MAASTRRELLQSASAVAAAWGLSALGPPPVLADERAAAAAQAPPKDDLTHLVSRITFGPRPDDLVMARRLGYEGYLEYQLDYESIDDSAFEDALHAKYTTLALPLGELLALGNDTSPHPDPFTELQLATIERVVAGPRQLFEVMVGFWSNHFNVAGLDRTLRLLKPFEDHDVIRRHALGSFGQLLQPDAASPAMLFFLDNVSNVKGVPNENYAREVMELHTLGLGGGYTEDDVKAVARIFTGWGFDRTAAAFTFYDKRHDSGPKTALGVDFPAGHGLDEGQRLLDLLARHPSTAAHIASKLATHFVADVPPPALVGRAADTFTATDGDIRAVLRTILTSDEFLASKDAKLKRPVEYVGSLLRATAAAVGDQGYESLLGTLRTLGQAPFSWPAPNGVPDVAPYWTSTNGILTRFNFALGVSDGALAKGYTVDPPALAAGATTPSDIVAALTARVLHRPVSAADRETLVGFAAGSGSPTAALTAPQADATARGVLGLLLCSPYFQFG